MKSIFKDHNWKVIAPSDNSVIFSLLEIVIEGPSNVEYVSIQVSLLYPDNSQVIEESEQENIREGRTSFILHTHLIRNGLVILKVNLQSQSGSSFCLASRRYHVKNNGKLSAQVKNSLQESGVNIFEIGPPDSSLYDYSDSSLKPWFDSDKAEDHINGLLEKKKVDIVIAEVLRQFVDQGFILLESFIEDDLIQAINASLDEAIDINWQGYKPYSSQRLEGLHLKYEPINKLWLHPEILKLLRIIFEEDVIPCQTLSYICGSQQDAHQDTIHLTPFPAGYMCGVWVALEDVQPGSGELFYYPRSHRTKRLYMNDKQCGKVRHGDWTEFAEKIVKEWQHVPDRGNFDKVLFYPKKGSVLIWHENLLHGGAVRENKYLTRKSIVSHYFANGSLIYFDSTGSVPFLTKPDQPLSTSHEFTNHKKFRNLLPNFFRSNARKLKIFRK